MPQEYNITYQSKSGFYAMFNINHVVTTQRYK